MILNTRQGWAVYSTDGKKRISIFYDTKGEAYTKFKTVYHKQESTEISSEIDFLYEMIQLTDLEKQIIVMENNIELQDYLDTYRNSYAIYLVESLTSVLNLTSKLFEDQVDTISDEEYAMDGDEEFEQMSKEEDHILMDLMARVDKYLEIYAEFKKAFIIQNPVQVTELGNELMDNMKAVIKTINNIYVFHISKPDIIAMFNPKLLGLMLRSFVGFISTIASQRRLLIDEIKMMGEPTDKQADYFKRALTIFFDEFKRAKDVEKIVGKSIKLIKRELKRQSKG